jgi:hypothetical protein
VEKGGQFTQKVAATPPVIPVLLFLHIWVFVLFYGHHVNYCQMDLCDLLGSGKAPENGTIS